MSASTGETQGPGLGEGPLAHEARVTSERDYLDGMSESRQRAQDRASGARPERTAKRLLVALSHSIEKAVLSGPLEAPTVVVALFQRLRFFDREREVYEKLAAAGALVIVGFVEGGGHRAPDGVHVVTLRPDEALADEWSVVAVGPRAGAFLVATDQHAFDSSERDPEAGREFLGRWGYSRAQAATELARLRVTLGERLDATLARTIDELLAVAMPSGGHPANSAGMPGETWATTSLNHMIDGMQTARAGTRELREQLADAHRAAAARTAATVDPHSGVSNPDFLNRWSNPDGPNPLPIGLALFDVGELDGEVMRGDDRASYFAAHQVAAALGQPLGPVDAVVRLSAREFLVVVPGASSRHLAGLCDKIGEQLELASHGYPDISLRARIATIVTRSRPLPVRDLHASLDRLQDGASGPLDAGATPAGDRIVVSCTALHTTDHSGIPSQAAGRVREAPRPSARHEAAATTNGTATNGTATNVGSRTDSHLGPTAGRREPTAAGSDDPGEADHTAASERDGRFDEQAPDRRHRIDPDRVGDGVATEDRRADPPDVSPDRTSGTAREESPADLPQRTAQEALRRLVYGDGSSDELGGDPRARADVFADLSQNPNTDHNRQTPNSHIEQE